MLWRNIGGPTIFRSHSLYPCGHLLLDSRQFLFHQTWSEMDTKQPRCNVQFSRQLCIPIGCALVQCSTNHKVLFSWPIQLKILHCYWAATQPWHLDSTRKSNVRPHYRITIQPQHLGLTLTRMSDVWYSWFWESNLQITFGICIQRKNS